MSSKIRVRIDRDECIQCANCWDICPDVFEEGPDDGVSQIVKEYRVNDDPGLGEIPEELEDCAREAADLCSIEIIYIEQL
jgi:ferredoxin